MDGFALPKPRRRRRPSLTPMIDVVFLLLVFFMLAARFGPHQALPFATGAGGVSDWQGPPRLVAVAPETLRLNDQVVALAELPGALRPLLPDAGAAIVLRPVDGADMQRLLAVMQVLRAQGLDHLVLAE